MTTETRAAIASGVFYLAVGLVFLLDALDVVDLRVSVVLPVMLLAAGAGLLVSSLPSRS